MTDGNGAPPEAAPPQLNVLAQYTKDLSFENPNAPSSLAPQQQQPAINIQINVSANNVAENEFEVTLSVEGKAENAGKVMFSFDLAYAGVFRIVNVPKENLHPLVMIECPRLLVPVRARNHCHRRARWRVPAPDARPRRFRRPVSPEHGTAGCRPGRAGQAELNQAELKSRFARKRYAPRKSFQIGLSPSVAIKARCAARSSSEIRGVSGTSRCRRGISPYPPLRVSRVSAARIS